jgi:hypothetical protein
MARDLRCTQDFLKHTQTVPQHRSRSFRVVAICLFESSLVSDRIGTRDRTHVHPTGHRSIDSMSKRHEETPKEAAVSSVTHCGASSLRHQSQCSASTSYSRSIFHRLCMIPASILHAVRERIVLLFKIGTCAAQYTSPADIREDRYFTQCIIVLAHLNIVLLPPTTTTTTTRISSFVQS